MIYIYLPVNKEEEEMPEAISLGMCLLKQV